MKKEKINLNKIYEAITNGKKLTKELILKLGYKEEEFDKLIENNIITKTETGEYTLISVDNYFNYHIFLLQNGFTKEAISCLEMCYEKDPQNNKIIFALMKMYVRTKKYNQAFAVFEQLDNNAEKNLKQDTNLYLYLLSIVCNYPEKYKERVLKLTYSDIKTTDSNKYPEINNQNRLRTFLIDGQHTLAIYLYKNKLVKLFPEFQERLFIEELFKQIIEVEEKKYFSFQTLIETQNYEEIVKYIETKRTTKKINYFEALTYYISKKIITINLKKEVPIVKEVKTNTLKEVLKSDNYKLLLQIVKNADTFNKKERDILIALLNNINKLVEKINEEKQTNINGYARKKTINKRP